MSQVDTPGRELPSEFESVQGGVQEHKEEISAPSERLRPDDNRRSVKTVRFGVPTSIDLKIWSQLDPQNNSLTRLKIKTARKDYRSELKTETSKILCDNRGNLNSIAISLALFRMQLKKADEFAEHQYFIFRDVWVRLGGVESAAFIRTISWMVIQPTFDVRGSSVAHEEKRRFRRSGSLHSRVSPETVCKGFDELKTKWLDKLETKAMEWEAETQGKAVTVAMHNSTGETAPPVPERSEAGRPPWNHPSHELSAKDQIPGNNESSNFPLSEVMRALVVTIKSGNIPSGTVLRNLTGGGDARPPLAPQEQAAPPLTRSEIADYLERAGWDPDNARELAAAELAVDFGDSLTSKHLRGLANLIANTPEGAQATLLLQTVDLLARWLLRKRQAVGPDGRIVVGVTSLGEARKIIAAWIGDELARQKNIELDQMEAPARLREPASRSEALEEATELSAGSFVRETAIWSIKFEGESCRLPHMLGLAYLSILLQNPLKPMRGLELQNATADLAFVGRSTRKLASHSLADDSASEDTEDKLPSSQEDFGRDKVLDDKARREVEARMLEIERDLAYKGEIHDTSGIDALQKEHLELVSYLGRSRNMHRRSRVFANENEKARTSITKALKRAYEDIREQAPKTAAHLESHINTGSEFMYRDASRSWKVRRTT